MPSPAFSYSKGNISINQGTPPGFRRLPRTRSGVRRNDEHLAFAVIPAKAGIQTMRPSMVLPEVIEKIRWLGIKFFYTARNENIQD